jgi:hypothetical protein
MKYEFKPPFRVCKFSDWIYDANDNFCCQFMADLPTEKIQAFRDIVNGVTKPQNENTYVFNENKGVITINGKNLILIRGWGFLTGVGGLNLPDDEAFAIQNKLGRYLTEKLNG